jgi:hypothetical protein
MEGGTTIADSMIAAREFEKAGIDILDISGGFLGFTYLVLTVRATFPRLLKSSKKSCPSR